MLHRVHTWTFVVGFVLVMALLTAAARQTVPFALELLLPLVGFFWSVQFIFAAVLLGTYTVRTART